MYTIRKVKKREFYYIFMNKKFAGVHFIRIKLSSWNSHIHFFCRFLFHVKLTQKTCAQILISLSMCVYVNVSCTYASFRRSSNNVSGQKYVCACRNKTEEMCFDEKVGKYSNCICCSCSFSQVYFLISDYAYKCSISWPHRLWIMNLNK